MQKSLTLLVGLCFAGLLVEAAETKQEAAGQFGLQADGSNFLGFVKSYSGGSIQDGVAGHQLGPDNVSKRHQATIIYEPLTIEVGMGMSKDFYEWISATWGNGRVTKNVELLAFDIDMKVAGIREFRDAYIAEVTIPTLDGNSKDPAYMTAKIEPASVRYRKGDGIKVGAKSKAAKKWLSSNFRLTIGDLPTSRVSKIESFSWKQTVTKDEVGQFRQARKQTSKVEVPNVKLTISMADYEPWQEWANSVVIDGKTSASEELAGNIVFLGPDLKTEFARIDLSNVGIISMGMEKAEANKESVARFAVELSVEKMAFSSDMK